MSLRHPVARVLVTVDHLLSSDYQDDEKHKYQDDLLEVALLYDASMLFM